MSEFILSYGICHNSAAPLRAEPSHRAEMTSQILFGERFSIKRVDDESNRWYYIENLWDGYNGWIHAGHVTLIEKKAITRENKYITSHHQDRFMMGSVCYMNLPLGSELFQLRSGKPDWYFKDVRFKGKKLRLQDINSQSREHIVHNAQQYLGAPYLWGGKSIMGIDCSGLSQMAYKLSNISLPRDASQQVDRGQTVDFIEQSLPGDLAFFDNEEGAITHVGIMIDQNTIIHGTESAGGVVIDSIDNGGIISQKLKKRTHQLRIIKRIISE